MRLSSGYAKGMQLKSPKGTITRPTSEKVRAAVFDSLSSCLQDAHFLDLFSGTGAMGLEALSRGAAASTFVESDRKALEALRENTKSLKRYAEMAGLEPNFNILGGAVEVALIHLRGPFDLIWCDPPYAKCIEWAHTCGMKFPELMQPNGLWIFESAHQDLPKITETLCAQNWQCLKSKKYGSTAISTWSLFSNQQP